MTPHWIRGCLRQSNVGDAPEPLVLKIGGSLLSWSDWPRRLDRLIAGFGDIPLVIVVGGGAVVDGLRQIDAAAPQQDRLMHELALDGMHLLAQIVSRSTGLQLSTNPERTRAACILDVPTWLLTQDRSTSLPASWDVTSDSIAARVAGAYDAALMLAKSTPPPAAWSGTTFASLVETGWVDRFFPQAAAGVRTISWTAPAG